MGGFNSHYLPQEQSNPVLSGLMMAYQVANQMKQQAMDQENMRMREAHQKRLDNADDLKTQMELQRSGAKPLAAGQNSTSETMTTPATTLPGADGQPLLTIPGSSQQTQVPVDPSTVVTNRNSGQRYAMPTDMEQLTRAMQWKTAEGQAGNNVAMDLFQRKNAITRPQDVEDAESKSEAEAAKDTAKAKATRDQKVWDAARQQTRDSDRNAASMDRTKYIQGQENARNASNNARMERNADAGGSGAGKKLTANQLRQISDTKNKQIADSFDQYQEDVHPTKSGAKPMKRADALTAHLQRNQAAQNQYEEALKSAGYPTQHVTYTPQGAMTAAKNGAAAKSATQAQVAAYAAQKGITAAQAAEEFKQSNYTVR